METKGVSDIPLSPSHQAVKLRVDGKVVNAEIYLRIRHHFNVIEVGKKVQENINRVIRETIDMEPGIINIHVVDIDFVASSADKA